MAAVAIDRGINYFDTAPDYSEAGSETALGKAMLADRPSPSSPGSSLHAAR